MQRTRRMPTQKRRGFTLLELLIVIVVITMLLGILSVALVGARDRAKDAKSKQLLSAVSLAVAAYKNEFGFYPPEVGPDGWSRADQRSDGDSRWDYDVEREEYTSDGLGYHVSAGSQFTIAHHLVGRNRMITTPGGDERETDGVIGPGLRRPTLPNGYLSTTDTSFTPPESGRVYSAFLDLSDPKAFVSIPDSAGVESVVVVDAYGKPIRYFNFNDPTQPAKSLEHDPGGTNATFSERLLSVVTGPQYQGTFDFANDPETRPMALRGQAFAVVSGGQDGHTGHWVQESVWGNAGSPYEDLDDEEVMASWREDNLVEVGS